MRTFDQIIDANMTVTDQLLRQAIHGVMVDLLYEVREDCAKICDEIQQVAEGMDQLRLTDAATAALLGRGLARCAAAIRGEESPVDELTRQGQEWGDYKP